MKRLLLVEPDQTAQEQFLLFHESNRNNWDLEMVATAEEALAKFDEQAFDLVIAANALEGQKTGLDLLQVLKDISPETVRFLLVGSGEQNSLRALVGAPQQVLVKPLELKMLNRQINRAFMLRSVIQDPSILKLLGKAESLPPLPRVFREVAQKLNDRNTSLMEISNVIAEDIILSSKVLKLANSALFNLRTPANSVGQAVSLLGIRTLSSLVFSQSVGDMFKGGAASERFVEDVNQHSLEVASMASNILYTWNAERQLVEKAVFCGIAHDIGKLVLAKYAPEAWERIQIAMAHTDRFDTEIERDIVGISHSEIAAYLLAIWGFPNDQVIAVAFHHEPSKVNEREFGLLGALHLAESLVPTTLHRPRTDWNYLADCRITPDDVAALATMLTPPAPENAAD
ncbi:MAG: HDOD domain-containing protein [Pontiellaceae bacterium]|nr:HDOD domain-containing protein [Pontiellaceae bacterium]MBN2785816.1 HDOD domain-containing protein [Pontiellaceae bacterium]